MGKAKVLAAPRPSRRSYVRDTDRVRAEPLVLIVCPTRELACQIFDDCRRLCYRSMLRPCVIYGGAAPRLQREQLEMGCDVLIATPGRLMDFMRQANLISFARLKYVLFEGVAKSNSLTCASGSLFLTKPMSCFPMVGRTPWRRFSPVLVSWTATVSNSR